MRKKWLFFGLPLLAAAPAVVLGLLSAFSRRPESLGAVDGRLADCPASPNCVATQSGRPSQRMSPWPFEGSPQAAMERLKQIVSAMPRARIVAASESYLHAEFASALMHFVDDVEFLIDPAAKLIHFRSASRVGYSDLGANRRRMEDLRRRWQGG
ncbi:MAG TPA: DUF1499 domain-containing protein [Pirellulales bacterium]|nr:DUF1499 domain-containing protein [Pirellulales bacterium]